MNADSHAEEFAKRLMNDPMFVSEVKANAASPAALDKFAKSQGYDLSGENLYAALQSAFGGESGALTDKELDAVSGGWFLEDVNYSNFVKLMMDKGR